MVTTLLTFALIVTAAVAAGSVLMLRAALATARNRALLAERVSAAQGRSLSLAAQEIRGIAACMSGCRAGERTSRFGVPVPLCTGAGSGVTEGPAQQLLRLADTLAEAARPPSTRIIREAPTRLEPVVQAAVALVSTQIRPGMRHWQVDPALRMLTVNADSRALEGALAALLRRAASHSRDGDVIGLRAVLASETVAIVVEDEGDGLAAPDLVPDSVAPTAGTRGLDLGLSLARSLAAAHGGDIRLETAPGIGARAWLTLPRTRLLEAA
jgi:signal transduction histidine kinase